MSVWAHVGFYALILLAGLQAIPKDLYEAAEMDGTRPWRVFWRITLPLLVPNLLVVLVLALIRAVQIFDEVYVLTGGGPGTSTLYLTQYIFETGFASLLRNPGLAAAASILMGVVLVVLTLMQLGHRAAQRKAGQDAMSRVSEFIFRRRGGTGWHWTDIVTWVWLIGGLILMFGPALWLVAVVVQDAGGTCRVSADAPALCHRRGDGGGLRQAAAALQGDACRRHACSGWPRCAASALVAQMIDPADPGEIVKVDIQNRRPLREHRLRDRQLYQPFVHFDFLRYLRNSVFVTTMATLITLLINSMAAFALTKYKFRGRSAVMMLILATLMVPLWVIMVPLYSIISALGLVNNLWGVILPTVATPTGVFLLRQYMLTIPDELIDAARMDKASEWQIYWRIVLPLAAPALAVLGIFSVVWRWNDFLWPLIVLSRKELYTLQVGLNIYSGELNVQWHYILAMTVVTMIPVVLVFVFLQRFITTGIAGSGLK